MSDLELRDLKEVINEIIDHYQVKMKYHGLQKEEADRKIKILTDHYEKNGGKMSPPKKSIDNQQTLKF